MALAISSKQTGACPYPDLFPQALEGWVGWDSNPQPTP
jgi:hypothetical protein